VEHGRDALAVRVLRFAASRFRAAEDWALLAGAAGRTGDDAVAADAGRRAIAAGNRDPGLLIVLAAALYHSGDFVGCEHIAQDMLALDAGRAVKLAGLHAMARALAGQGRHVDGHAYAKLADELGREGEMPDELARDLAETLESIVAQDAPPVRTSLELSMERHACDELEAGAFESLVAAVSSPSWGIARIALAACEVRRDDEGGIPVAPRALDAALTILARSRGASHPDAVLARIRALRIRDNAFLQIDPPPPLGVRFTVDEFERAYAARAKALT
ncbi:MAG TPA: hypothetical protein VFP84_15695, partial [Kofleriaceae bacterium]|nr:hypothetical protein [Kofleriaceae bacterium]